MNATCTMIDGEAAAPAPAAPGFEELYAEFQPRVFAYCRAVLRHDEDALDAAQETMLAVFRHFDELRQVRSVWNFLRRIAANKCNDLLRRRRLHARWLGSLRADDMEPIVVEHDSCDVLPEDEARLQAGLLRSIARLSVRLRRAVELRYVRGFDCRRIASELGISPGTVKSRLSRAREKLARSAGVAALRAHGLLGRQAS
jgi:RNA polymerase sigma-70 factor (ECF subfamily)